MTPWSAIIMLVNGYERYDKMKVRWIFCNCKNTWFISLLFLNINKNRISSNLLRICWIDVLKSLDDNDYYHLNYHKVQENLLRDTWTNLFWWVRSENFGESHHCKNKKKTSIIDESQLKTVSPWNDRIFVSPRDFFNVTLWSVMSI